MPTNGQSFHKEPVYQDNGCQWHPHCLSCPYPLCFEDDQWAFIRARRREERRRIAGLVTARLVAETGLPKTQAVQEVARAAGVTIRTVFRAMERAR